MIIPRVIKRQNVGTKTITIRILVLISQFIIIIIPHVRKQQNVRTKTIQEKDTIVNQCINCNLMNKSKN